jgi:Flagellar biosynthesis protein, FliO
MKQDRNDRAATTNAPLGGVAGWLLKRLRVARRSEPRLAVLERITLAPRQSLALIEAEGRRFLVATSPEGTPAFYALDQTGEPKRKTSAGSWNPGLRTTGKLAGPQAAERSARVSW